MIPATVKIQLATIRKQMSAALRAKHIDEYHRLGAVHRKVLHAASPAIKVAWERCRNARPSRL